MSEYQRSGEYQFIGNNDRFFQGNQRPFNTSSVAEIRKKHSDAKEIHVILDNASYYKSKLLRERLAGSKIILHYLSGYSPNLNVIERLWKFFKKKILYNRYYEKFDDFLSACKGFLRYKKKFRDELRTLLTEKFQTFNKKNEI
ncbi:MAG: transposase [Planctomycetaceae bacterium]|jgi:transposase|nr:transposase [Planctomycetaceae bacterium]